MEFYTIIFPERDEDFIAWGLSWYEWEPCANYAHENIHTDDEYAIALVIEED
jgi:hypothetical protein